ncbi:3'-5' exoribonuclease [Hafnia alvei]|uniref:3'-5' exonuclease n=1 Tax=Hafnia alvei TaxID=569 RepID=UPI000B7144E7|nr:3'-5' exonuclease [Hafnia alvei]MBI0277290.1 3'-5' exoribonuclease [Hafnia alvei]MBI0278513.1 3'-5' exoribonuclease [Hafnia alvei]PNK96243.1 3'-5' exoribonuclease [Hafnia alvei]PNK97577.1 3'-5' exoribonuclease [Hafnia alvei]
MNHVMIDIETLGTGTNAPVASIGAVFFEPSTGCTGARFYVRVNAENDELNGAVASVATFKWWLKQSAEARAELLDENALPIWEAMQQLNEFLSENAVPEDLKWLQVWANSPAFDCSILRAAYVRADTECPWKFWNERDCRTMVEIGKVIGFNPKHDLPFSGERHNALADAVHQAQYISHIWQHLTADKEPML